MSIIGIAYDKYSSTLKAQIFTDILKLAAAGLDQVEIIGENSGQFQEMLSYCGVSLVVGREPPTWRVYTYEKEPVLPDYAETIIRKDMAVYPGKGIKLLPNSEQYPSLYRQADNRVVPPGVSIDLNRPPPRVPRNAPYSLPMNHAWQPFI